MPTPIHQVSPSANTAQMAAAITPNDVSNQVPPFRAIYVGVGGDINLTCADSNTVLFSAVAAGIFPVGGVRVNATGTTASKLVVLY